MGSCLWKMMIDEFVNGERRNVALFGHAFTRFPQADEPNVIARFDGVNGDYALFTVEDNGQYPRAWSGTYCLPLAARQAWDGGKA